MTNDDHQPVVARSTARNWARHSNPAFRGVEVAFLGEHARLLRVQPAGLIAPHQHPGEWDFSYVLQGHGRAAVGDTDVDVKAGDYFGVPPGTTHSVKNMGNDDLLILLHRFRG